MLSIPIRYGTRNSLINRQFARAADKQSPSEHRRLLQISAADRQKIRMAPPQTRGILLAAAKQKAVMREKQEPKYWNTDTRLRKPLGPSSGWIRNIQYNPTTGMTRMLLGSKSYSYNMNPHKMRNFLLSRSLGQFYNRSIKRG